MIYVGPLEAFWIALNMATAIYTVDALRDALRDWRAFTRGRVQPDSRRMSIRSAIRQETLRLLMQAILLSVAVPGLFVDQPVVVSAVLLLFLLLPVILFVQSALDRRHRHALPPVLAAELMAERLATEARIEAAINIRLATANRKVAEMTATPAVPSADAKLEADPVSLPDRIADARAARVLARYRQEAAIKRARNSEVQA